MDETTLLVEITKVGEGVKAVHRRLDDVVTSVDKMETTMHGNGQPGVVPRLFVVESRLKLWGGMGGALLTAILVADFVT